jgi:hypothetical protein
MPKDRETKEKVAKKPAAPRRPRARKAAPAVTHDHIAERAYFISLESGGDPLENWIRAERELVPA